VDKRRGYGGCLGVAQSDESGGLIDRHRGDGCEWREKFKDCKSDTEVAVTDTDCRGTGDWRVNTEFVVTDRTSSGEK
jgi:hypothetical protein